MFSFRFVPAVLMLTALTVLGLPTGSKNQDHHHSPGRGNLGLHESHGVPFPSHSKDAFEHRHELGQNARHAAQEQTRRELQDDYLYARDLDHVKFTGQFAEATEEHKAHITQLVHAHHAALPEGHEHKGASQAVVFKDFHHTTGEDTSGPKHATVSFYKGAVKSKNRLGVAAHIHDPSHHQ